MVAYQTDPDAALRAILERRRFAFDLETTGLDPILDRIGVLALQVGEQAWLLREVPPWFGMILEDPSVTKLGFNAAFDLAFLFRVTGATWCRNLHDLYLEELLVSAQRRGLSHSLQATLDRRLGVEIAKGIDHGQVDWTGPLDAAMVQYALEDVKYLEALHRELHARLDETGQERAAEIENAAVPAVAWMRLNGLGVDAGAWEAQIAAWEAQIAEAVAALDQALPGVSNWNSRNEILAALEAARGVRLPNLRRATVRELAAYLPELQLLLDYKLAVKRHQVWGQEYLEKYRHPLDGRIRPEWRQFGTNTGRFSCTHPNLQQLPREPAFRRLIRARDGHLLISCDYSQIEVVASAVYANDQRLLQILASGGDTHREVAALISGKPPEAVTKEERQRGKICNFGLQFGGGARALVRQARELYGVTLELGEAQALVRRYFQLFPGLARVRQQAYERFRCRAEPACPRALDGQPCPHLPSVVEVHNLVGLRRLLVGEERKPTTYLNTIIQSSAGSGIKAAMGLLGELGYGRYLVAQVHDELVFEVPVEEADAAAPLLARAMVKGMRMVLGAQAPVRVDVEMDETWCAQWTCARCGEAENVRQAVVRGPCRRCGAVEPQVA